MKGSVGLRVGLAIAGILMAGLAFAQGPGGSGPMDGQGRGMDGRRPPFERAFGGRGIEGRWWNNPRIVEQLKLTDDQRKAFDQILLQHREILIDLRANLEKAELALEPLIGNDQPNESAILAQIDKVAQARAELEKANARYLLALRSKLTPEQWKQVQDLRQNREQMHGGWGQGGRRQGRPDGNGPNTAPPPPGPKGMLDDGAGPEPPAGAEAAGVNQ
jgi:periplasmic protein CpxP/Spy